LELLYKDAVSVKLSAPDDADTKSYQTLRKYKWVADSFPVFGRPNKLAWSHYERIALLPEDMFSKLLEVEGSVQWWLGDMLRIGQTTYTEVVSVKLSTPDGEDALKYQQLRNYKWVADAFPVSGRPDKLLI